MLLDELISARARAAATLHELAAMQLKLQASSDL
jgi:hypothetical protein